ncbi:MAG: pitrilysin family protein [Alphaproteobacteria bacterium]
MSIEQAELPNGMRIVTDRMDSVETVTLGVWVLTGTRNETADINGISHLLEHMAFKGTRRRSAKQIAVEIENVGGHLNAYTSRETTVYYATVLKEDVPLALDILADILTDSVFDEEELARERSVILQEIGQANDTPDDIVFDRFQETAFPDQPLGWPILGTAETVRTMPRTRLIDYIGAQYGGRRMILAAAGNLDHAALVRIASERFEGLAPGDASEAAPGSYRGGEFRDVRDLEQAHLVLGFEGIGYADPDYYALAVLSTALGGGMSSRLFQTIREERGLVYSIYSFSSAYRDGGIFGIYAGTGEGEVAELLDVTADELRAVAAAAMDEDEIARARAQIKAGVLMSLESTSSRAERIARQIMIFGRPVPIPEIAAKIDAVTPEDARRVAGRLFSTAPTVAALGPVGALQEYDAVKSALVA